MNKDELKEKRNRTIESLNDIKAILGLDELYIDELEKELADAKKVQVVEHFEAYGQCRDSRRITELEQENAELKEKYVKNITDCDICDTYCNSQLTKAKDHIKKLLDCLQQDTNDPQTNYYVVQYMTEAVQFLLETDIDNAIQKANEGLNFDKIAEEIEQDIKEQSNS